MSAPKEPGDGWRFLEFGEYLQVGDEAWTILSGGTIGWLKLEEVFPGQRIDTDHVLVRRKLPEYYLLGRKRRGNLNVTSLRLLDKKAAIEKAKSLKSASGWYLTGGWSLWKVHSNKEPEILKKKDYLELYKS